MNKERLHDRLVQVVGFAVAVGLALALLFAFRAGLLPYQEEGDVFGTVYVLQPEESSEASHM